MIPNSANITGTEAPHQHEPPGWLRRRSVLGCLIAILLPLSCINVFALLYIIFPPHPMDMLLLGLDARPGQGYLTRSDSFMMLNITPSDLRVNLLSIPRDVFIQVPDYGEQRINTINALGEQEAKGSGPALIEASIQESFGVTMDRYVRLDFGGFVKLVDAVGGITIDVPKLIIDYDYPTIDGGVMTVRFDPGREHMDGERALQYARTRHQDDDYQRAARQQQVVDALIKKLSSPGQIVHWPKIWKALQDYTDTDMSAWDILRWSPALLAGWPNRTQRVLQREDLIGMKAGYWRPNYDELVPWIQDHFD